MKFTLESSRLGNGSMKSFVFAVLLLILCCGSDLQAHHPSLMVVQYADSSIDGYSTFSEKANDFYFDAYNLFPLSFPAATSELESILRPLGLQSLIGSQADKRWEKVACLLTLMEIALSSPSHPDAHLHPILQHIHQTEYFVWMDADIVILDYSRDIFRDIVAQSPTHDLFISSEYHAETGVANTGCFIIKKSMWSLEWLRQWWAQDHTKGHDQILFNSLYRSTLSTSSSLSSLHAHIYLLPFRALNSQPPAPLTLSRSDAVLHLMGEREDFRREVFSLCLSLLQQHPELYTQRAGHLYDYGLTRERVVEILWRVIAERLPALYSLITNQSHSLYLSYSFSDEPQQSLSDLCHAIHTSVIMEQLGEYRELLLQQQSLFFTPSLSSVDVVEALSSRQRQLHSLYDLWRRVYDRIKDEGGGVCRQVQVDILNTLSWVGHDLLHLFISSDSPLVTDTDREAQIVQLFDEVDTWLYQLQLRVHLSQRTLIREMRALALQNRADLCLSILLMDGLISPRTIVQRESLVHQRHDTRRQLCLSYSQSSVSKLTPHDDMISSIEHMVLPWLYFAVSLHLSPETAEVSLYPPVVTVEDILHRETELNPFQYLRLLKDLGSALCLRGNNHHSADQLRWDGLRLFGHLISQWERILLIDNRIATGDKETMHWQDDHAEYLQVLCRAVQCILLSDYDAKSEEWERKIEKLKVLFPSETSLVLKTLPCSIQSRQSSFRSDVKEKHSKMNVNHPNVGVDDENKVDSVTVKRFRRKQKKGKRVDSSEEL